MKRVFLSFLVVLFLSFTVQAQVASHTVRQLERPTPLAIIDDRWEKSSLTSTELATKLTSELRKTHPKGFKFKAKSQEVWHYSQVALVRFENGLQFPVAEMYVIKFSDTEWAILSWEVKRFSDMPFLVRGMIYFNFSADPSVAINPTYSYTPILKGATEKQRAEASVYKPFRDGLREIVLDKFPQMLSALELAKKSSPQAEQFWATHQKTFGLYK